MREFILTQPYATIEEMQNSVELQNYKKELEESNIDIYAIVSRIGNRYDIYGNRIDEYAQNPYLHYQVPVDNPQESIQNVVEPVDVEIKEKNLEENNMKYVEIENLIDTEIAKAVDEKNVAHEQEMAQLKANYEQELTALKQQHAIDLINAKEAAKAELIAKLNA